MVRRKEDLPAREVSVRVAKKAAGAAGGEPTPKLRRPLKIRRRGGWGKGSMVILMVIILLGLGWFATRAAITGLNLMNNGQGGWLATLFNIKTTKLIGEEEGRVNVMLMGIPGDPTHDGPNLTDTLMLASYNTKDTYLTLFSVPRDLQVNASDNLGIMKINAVYENGQSKSGDGTGVLSRTVENLTGLTVPYYIKIDFAGFKQLVDELGGIKIDVKKDLLDTKYPADTGDGYQTVDIKAGSYTMDGEMALKYARSRQSTSDFDRARRQQDVLMALRNKAQDLELLTAPVKMLAISDIIKDHFSTNLNKDEMVRLIQLTAGFDTTKITNKVMDEASGLLYGGKNDAGAYVLRPKDDDYNKIKDFVATAIAQTTPESESQAAETVTPLKIEVLNGTSVTGLAGKAAETLKAAGYTIVRVGNNPTKGIAKTTIYGSSNTELTSAVQTLAGKVSGTVSASAITLPAGVDARVVVGADYPTQ